MLVTPTSLIKTFKPYDNDYASAVIMTDPK